MKKVIAVFLMFVLIISCTVVTSAEEITIDEKIWYLISHGVPEDFLENKEEPDISELYDSLYGEMFEFTGTQTVEMSESVGFPGISALSTIPESDMKLSITTFTYFDYDNSTSTKTKIKEVKVCVDYIWADNKPFINNQDGISVNWDSGIFTFKSNSFHATDYKMLNSSGTWVEYSSQTNPATLNQGGLGYYANLCTLDLVQSAQKGTAYFTLLPKQSIYYGNDYVASIYAQYVHDKNPYTIVSGISFSLSGVGVNIDLSLLKDSVTAAANFRYKL